MENTPAEMNRGRDPQLSLQPVADYLQKVRESGDASFSDTRE